VQEVGFPTRNGVEGGRRPVCTSAARKIGVLLARARDGVPQEGLVSLLCEERKRLRLLLFLPLVERCCGEGGPSR
jgi:hypothetical protein